MAMAGPAMASDMLAFLASAGFVGVELAAFTSAIGNGTILGLVGKTFTTSDTGAAHPAGVGAGVGIGITGVTQPVLKSAILAGAVSNGFILTPEFDVVANAIATAFATQLALASLVSSHVPQPPLFPLAVFAGTGVALGVGPTGFAVDAVSWLSSIQSAAPTFLGPDWPIFCSVLGNAYLSAFGTAMGTVTITGSPGPIPPSPAPGIGAGTGVVS